MVGAQRARSGKRGSLQEKAAENALFRARAKKAPPFQFVLEAIESLRPWTRPMFGCVAVYVKERIVFILRDKPAKAAGDNGVWLATTKDHHESLRRDFPNMRSIAAIGPVTGWQNLPSDSEDFEEAVLRACEMVLAGDPRIGKIPAGKKTRSTGRASAGRGSR